jgi:LmbE family N-acetylglucosaminyl deacetylase
MRSSYSRVRGWRVRNVVFVFAHQDDEVALASRIRFERARGSNVICVCLTDGAAAVPAKTRDDESRRVLTRLGVTDFRIMTAQRIPDGTLPDHLDDALAFLEASIAQVDEVVTLAWEGGHQDHDAAHLVSLVFASKRGVQCLELPLYNGYRVREGFFRVNNPPGDDWTVRRLSRREYFANVLLARFYPSQRKTWLGLGPLLLIGKPRELTRVGELRRVTAPPHPRPLLYERRFRYPYDRFAARAAEFLRRQRVLPD